MARIKAGRKITRRGSWVLPLAASLLVATKAAAQPLTIGIIDLYGRRTVAITAVTQALLFREGDTLSMSGKPRPARIIDSEARLERLPGVQQAQISIVCCDGGRAIAYVGLAERGAPIRQFRPAPTGNALLPADIVQAGDAFSTALQEAVRKGNADEDRADGHAMAADTSVRAIQEQFIALANRDVAALRLVLRTASNSDHRALAAQLLGYAADKASVIDDLVQAMNDPSESVRNNAMRALMVMAEMTPRDGRSALRIPATPFVALLHSLSWSDRNKASAALEVLTRSRDVDMLASLRREAIEPLAEMARWKSDGHAQAAYFALARVGGYSDQDAFDNWQQGRREAVITTVLSQSTGRATVKAPPPRR